jgi:4-hydroxy-2-oxoheptanedioate aldolase
MSDTPINHLKTRLLAGEVQYGLFIALVDQIAAEITAGAGFDWVMIETEHAPNDLRTALTQLQAVAASGVPTLVRPTEGETVQIKRLLDIGVQTLLVPMVESGEQARQLVSAMRYPPHGIRGVGSSMARAAQWNRHSDYLAAANDQMCLIVQIESVEGAGAIEDIAAVDGVDALFVGPSDLAASMGHLGNSGHPEVVAAVTDCINRIRAAGKPVGIFATTVEAAKAYVAQGCSFIAIGSDITLLAKATTALAAAVRSE